MPSVVINEKDYSIFNIYANNDNIVWIPGFAITGPYDEPVLLNSPLDLINTFGDTAPATQYASGATSATYRMATGYEFASQMLNKGFRVLFQRIAPYTVVDGALVLDTTKLKSAGIEIADTNFVASGTTPTKFKIVARDGGTYGNRLNVVFTMNVNQNKLYLKVTDTTTNTVLEYKEICSAKFKSGTNTVDPSYILGFAKGFVSAIDSSDYITLESGTGYVSDVTSINNYIKTHISGTTGTFTQNDDGTLSYSDNDLSNANLQGVTADGNTINLFDAVLINPQSIAPTATTVTNVRSSLNISKGIVKGKTFVNTEKINVWDSDSSTVKTEDKIVATDVIVGKDFTYNEAVDESYITTFADTLKVKLDIISDTILYDVKFITLGGIAVPSSLTTSATFGSQKLYSILAGFCATRGDCVAILEPNYGENAGQVQEIFNSANSGIGGTSASYASAFAPWGAYNLYNGNTVWSAPSMIFLSALADSVSSGNPVYLPPAGVNRASLPDLVTTEYRIGSTILNMWQNKDRPDNINPIMGLNNYGYVIFGQRTLYDVSDTVVGMRSALQELGVRLAVIELKKKIKQVATGLLFEYNNIHTWNEFKAGMYPMLTTMVNNGAVQAYQIIMDGTSTTPDDIDNNIIRGTIRIVPGRAVEDFIITFELYRSGVTFTNDGEE